MFNQFLFDLICKQIKLNKNPGVKQNSKVHRAKRQSIFIQGASDTQFFTLKLLV